MATRARVPRQLWRRWHRARLPRRRQVQATSASASSATLGSQPEWAGLQVEQFEARDDNYGYLLHDASTGSTAAVDTPELGPIQDALQRRGWKLTHVLNTHWHHDHTEANLSLKKHSDHVTVVGPAAERSKVPGIDVAVSHGDEVQLGSAKLRVLDVGGHTAGHIAYYIGDATGGLAFVGDVLFPLGCGRVFEGDAEQMYASLQRLAALPPPTRVYCGHEYALSNARFARHLEPENEAIALRTKEVELLREQGLWTVPTTIGAELETNPFMRCAERGLRKALHETAPSSLTVPDHKDGTAENTRSTGSIDWLRATDVEVFAEIRAQKDRFR